jgi:aerobic-type carbon monoxide dehydrogenase small subunit (CoxS/CutS family)
MTDAATILAQFLETRAMLTALDVTDKFCFQFVKANLCVRIVDGKPVATSVLHAEMFTRDQIVAMGGQEAADASLTFLNGHGERATLRNAVYAVAREVQGLDRAIEIIQPMAA